MIRTLLGTCLFAASMVALPATAEARDASRPKVGEIAPDFTLTLISGEKVPLSDLKGHVVVLNFWATWCVPCRKELPLLDAYYRKLKDQGLSVYAITTEGSVPLKQLKELFAVMAIPSVKSVKGPYQHSGAVPTNIVIGRDGKVRYFAPGSFDIAALNAIVGPLLAEPQPSPASAPNQTS